MTSGDLNAMRRRQMAMVFQSFALFPQRSVLENAAFGLEVAGVPRRERHDKALQALERVGLAQEARKRPRQLSGGMQQRVGLARALALDPPILLMDEAFSALDPLIRRDMQTLLLELQSEQQRTIVFISHDLDEAIRLGDRIALMQGGCLLQCDTAENLLHHPASDAVRHFFRDVDVASVLAVEAIAQRPSRLAVIAADEALPEAAGEPLYVLGRDQAFRGVLSEARGWVSAERGPALTTGMRVREAIELVASTPYPPPVLDDAHRLVGVISPRQLLQSMEGDT
jgi:ABC-type proline/glycine betaine transport system, ATPase component